MTRGFVTPISGVELARIMEETIVRLQRVVDAPAEHSREDYFRAENAIARLDFLHGLIDEEADYEFTLADWEHLNAGTRGDTWFLVS